MSNQVKVKEPTVPTKPEVWSELAGFAGIPHQEIKKIFTLAEAGNEVTLNVKDKSPELNFLLSLFENRALGSWIASRVGILSDNKLGFQCSFGTDGEKYKLVKDD